MQLYKISQKADLSQIFPTIKEIAFLFIYLVLFWVLISQSTEVLEVVYLILNGIAEGINSTAPPLAASIELDPNIDSIGELIGMLPMILIAYIGVGAAMLIAMLVGYMRAIQLYIYAAFAPIPFGLLAFEETRQWGLGFIKNFIALCISGAIMIFIMCAFPMLVADCFGGTSTIITVGAAPIAGGNFLFKLLVLCILLIFALIKSGSMARDLLGG
jgi:hypothetical protein